LAFTGLFDQIETSFFNPAVTTSMTREVARSAGAIDGFLEETKARFSQALEEPAVRRSFLFHQSAEDIFERSRIFGLLHETTGGLQWVRFIDSADARIHFSTYAPDIAAREPQSVTYRTFDEPEFPFQTVAASAGSAPRLILDGHGSRVLFSFPFYDYFHIYRGTALFSLSVRALPDGPFSVISSPPGFLSGAPAAFAEQALAARVSSVWESGATAQAILYSPQSGASLILLSARTTQGLFVGRLVSDQLFLFPHTMRIVLLLTFFFTVFLTVFLIFNIRQDPVTIVQSRMEKLQASLFEQYCGHKSDVDWSQRSGEIEQNREEISAQLKRGINATDDKAKKIDAAINTSWTEFFPVTAEEIKAVLATAQPLTQVAAQMEEELEEIGLAEDDAEDDGEGVEEIEVAELFGELELEEEGVEQLEELAQAASEIEFSDVPVPEIPVDRDDTWEDLEVTSPFSDTLFDFSTLDNDASDVSNDDAGDNDGDTGDGEDAEDGDDTEDDAEYGDDGFLEIDSATEGELIPLVDDDKKRIVTLREHPPVSGPFFNITSANIELLEALPGESANAPVGPDLPAGIIEEREGVPFINERALNSIGGEPGLNQRFKNLVDSVIKQS